MPLRDVSSIDFDQYSNRELALPPLAVLGVALLILGGWTVATGAPVTLGVDFVGGTQLHLSPTAQADSGTDAVAAAFSVAPDTVQKIPSENTYIVTFKSGSAADANLRDQAEAAGYTVQSSSTVSPGFGSGAQKLALLGIAVAFAGMSIIIFALFRTTIPCLAVVVSAFSDVVVPLAVMNLLGINLSLGVVAALLMLIGYSVDSDLLLTTYVLRRSGSFYESVEAAMDTGVTMTLTSMTAMLIMAVASTILGVALLRDIGIILFVGLFIDLLNTYMLNLSLLRWYKFEGVMSS